MHKTCRIIHILGTLDRLIRVNSTLGNPCTGSYMQLLNLFVSAFWEKTELLNPRENYKDMFFTGFPVLFYLYIFARYSTICIYTLLVFVGLFVSNKRQNGWTERVQILCGNLHDPREGLWIQNHISAKRPDSLAQKIMYDKDLFVFFHNLEKLIFFITLQNCFELKYFHVTRPFKNSD